MSGDSAGQHPGLGQSRPRPPPQSLANLRPPWTSDTAPRVAHNPGATVTMYHQAREMAAKATPEAMARLIELMRCDDPRVALIACESIINRGAGKPRDHSSEESKQRADLSMLTPDQRRQLAELLMRALGQTGDVIDSTASPAPADATPAP